MKQINWAVAGRIIISATLLFGAIMLVVSGLLGLLIKNEIMPQKMGGQALGAITATSAFLLCLYCAKKVIHSKLIVALFASAGMALLLLLGKVIFFAGRGVDVGWNLLFLFGAALLAGVVSSQNKMRKR